MAACGEVPHAKRPRPASTYCPGAAGWQRWEINRRRRQYPPQAVSERSLPNGNNSGARRSRVHAPAVATLTTRCPIQLWMPVVNGQQFCQQFLTVLLRKNILEINVYRTYFCILCKYRYSMSFSPLHYVGRFFPTPLVWMCICSMYHYNLMAEITAKNNFWTWKSDGSIDSKALTFKIQFKRQFLHF